MSAWTVIAHTEVGSGGAADITFLSVGNIPSTYTDLAILLCARNSAGTGAGKIVFNTSGGTYTRRRLVGEGTTASSDTVSEDYQLTRNGFTANTFGSTLIYIPNYAGSTAKSYSVDTVAPNNEADPQITSIFAGLWDQTAAITKIQLVPLGSSPTFVQYSSATLYGIAKGSSGGVTVS
jgi:hypothetical protein